MSLSLNWAHSTLEAALGGLDPTLERLRALVQPLRLYRAADAENGDLGELISFLERVMERRLVIHAPFTPERSFDETWLMAMIDAQRRVDVASYRFLLQSRMRSHEKASEAHFLFCRAVLGLYPH